MHSFPVLLALAVLNVAQAAPIPQAERKSIAHSTPKHPTDVKVPTNARLLKRAHLVRVCVDTDGTYMRQPVGGQCNGQWKDLDPDDHILDADTKPLIGNPVGTSAHIAVDKNHPGLDVKLDGAVLGIPLGHGGDDAQSTPSAASPGTPSSTDNGGFFGGNSGPTFLGLPGSQGSSSNSNADAGSNSNADADSGARDGKDGRSGLLTATLGTPILDPNSRGSKASPQPSENGNGEDGDNGDGAYAPNGGPVYAGHYGPDGDHHQVTPGSDQPQNAPGGDHGIDGHSGDNHGHHGANGADHGHDGASGGDHGSESADGGDHGHDGAGDDHGHDSANGGDNGYDGSSEGNHGHDGPGSDTNPDDCDEDGEGEGEGDQSSHSGPFDGHSHGGHGPAQPPYGQEDPAQSHSHPRPWSSRPKSVSPSPPAPKFRPSPSTHEDKTQPAHSAEPPHHPVSHSQSPPSSPSFSWTDEEPECGCEE